MTYSGTFVKRRRSDINADIRSRAWQTFADIISGLILFGGMVAVWTLACMKAWQ